MAGKVSITGANITGASFSRARKQNVANDVAIRNQKK
jgi:hypothetical protein